MELEESVHSDNNLDWLIKQTFEEFKQNVILIDRLHITITSANMLLIFISFGEDDNYKKYTKLYDDNNVKQTKLFDGAFCIGFHFEETESTIYTGTVTSITPDWLMNNLPSNVLALEYNRWSMQIYPFDKLPQNLDLLEITEIGNASNLEKLPPNITKLNLWNSTVKHNLINLPPKLKILILPNESCNDMSDKTSLFSYANLYPLRDNHQKTIVCHGRLQFKDFNQTMHFFYHDYMKYNLTFDERQNIFDKFLKNTFLRRKQYFKNKYQYSKTGWKHLATLSYGTYKVDTK